MVRNRKEDLTETRKKSKNKVSIKVLQRVTFSIKNFLTCQILILKKHNALDFERKLFRHIRFRQKNLLPKNHVLVHFAQ